MYLLLSIKGEPCKICQMSLFDSTVCFMLYFSEMHIIACGIISEQANTTNFNILSVYLVATLSVLEMKVQSLSA